MATTVDLYAAVICVCIYWRLYYFFILTNAPFRMHPCCMVRESEKNGAHNVMWWYVVVALWSTIPMCLSFAQFRYTFLGMFSSCSNKKKGSKNVDKSKSKEKLAEGAKVRYNWTHVCYAHVLCPCNLMRCSKLVKENQNALQQTDSNDSVQQNDLVGMGDNEVRYCGAPSHFLTFACAFLRVLGCVCGYSCLSTIMFGSHMWNKVKTNGQASKDAKQADGPRY